MIIQQSTLIQLMACSSVDLGEKMEKRTSHKETAVDVHGTTGFITTQSLLSLYCALSDIANCKTHFHLPFQLLDAVRNVHTF